MSAQSQRALNAYRSALRATKIAFTDDGIRLLAARSKIKSEMKLEKSTTHPKFSPIQRIELLENVSGFLKHNIVQGVKDNQETNSRYTLNIHKETELGDNEEIKKNKSRFTSATGSTGGGCCGGGNIELQQKQK